jgi:hypothetical protein
LEGSGIEPALVVKSVAKRAQRSGIPCEEIRREAGESHDPVATSNHLSAGPLNKEFPVCPALCGAALRLTDLVGLKVPMLISSDVCDVAELELEAQLFPRIIVEVETEDIEPFFAKCIRTRNSSVRIDRHCHDGVSPLSVE